MGIIATPLQEKAVAEVLNTGLNLQSALAVGELLTGTPTVVSSDVSLTITNQRINTGASTLRGVVVPIGMAVLFTLAGGTPTALLYVVVTVTTNGGETFVRKLPLKILA